MKKGRLLQLVSGIIAIIAGVFEVIYQFYNIKILHLLFVSGLIIYIILFILYLVIYKNNSN